MLLPALLREASRALFRHKLRSALAVLGVTIGIAAVVCTVTIGQAAERELQEQLRNLGDNLVWVEAGSRSVTGVRLGSHATKTLVEEDALAIQKYVPLIKAVSPQVDGRVQVIYGDRNWNTGFRGESPEYFDIRRYSLAAGSAFTQQDVEQESNVCVIGETVRQNLFGDEDPLGKLIRVRHLQCLVIGLLQAKGQSASGQDQDDLVVLPYTTAQHKLAGVTWLMDIMCSAVSTEAVPQAAKQIESLLRQRHRTAPGEDDDFNVRHPEELINARLEAAQTFAVWLATIASVSLLVGGIGIMNLMLVSVTERTREIGVRLAVGATTLQVKLQFLCEAILLSLVGGGAGVVFGLGGSILFERMQELAMVVSPRALLLAVVFAIGVGVLFGYFPAQRAAGLDPIEAVRYE